MRKLASVAGLLALAVWAAWWVESVRRDVLVFGTSTWVLPLPFLAGDFAVNLDHVARVRAFGLDPYAQAGDLACALSPYPPMIHRLFAWVAWFDPAVAKAVWTAALAGLVVFGAVAAWHARRRLGLTSGPWPVAVAAVAFGTPAVLAMERGQCDPLVVPPLWVAARLLNRRNAFAEAAAGALLGLTAWVKYYPGLAVVGLLALGRWRGVAAFLVVAGAIGAYDRAGVRRALDNGAVFARINRTDAPVCFPTKHAVAESWAPLWAATPLRPLGRIPGTAAAALLLLPAVVAVARRVARSADPALLVFPLFLWLTAAATFGMPYAIDYNLVPLCLAVVAVWDRRDGGFVNATLAALLVWWQPVALPVDGRLLFVVKLAALYAAGVSLARRAAERQGAPGRLVAFARADVAAAQLSGPLGSSSPSRPAQSRS